MEKLIIKNFKCFSDVEVNLNNLTVFAGGNGNGKSSAIQSLLLLRRTIEHCSEWKIDHFEYNKTNGLNVELNDVYCLGLGNSENILHVEYDSPIIELGLMDEENNLEICYDVNDGKELFITPGSINSNSYCYPNNPLFFQEFYYLNAERFGPRITQTLKFYDYLNVGFQGELTAQIIADIDSLEKKSDFEIDKDRILDDPAFLKGSRFYHHVNAWLSYIIDGVTIDAKKDSETHTARIWVENNFSQGKPISPTNTGFGISYSLPIIVACLIAKKERMLIIENPEAHLHPSAQSKMGSFLGFVANAGVKIIVETHSDHIINGIQIAVAKKNIDNSKVTINYFYKEQKSKEELEEEKGLGRKQQPLVKDISITEKGELSEWPKGFFDQTQIDFLKLNKIRRNV
jgi:predicted ATPase